MRRLQRPGRFGIRGRLIVNVVALVAISLWILGLMLLRQNVAFLAAERRERGRALATAVEKALGALLPGEAVTPGDPRLVAVQGLLASLAEDPRVAGLALRDGAGRTLAAAGGPADAAAESATYALLPRGAAPASLTNRRRTLGWSILKARTRLLFRIPSPR